MNHTKYRVWLWVLLLVLVTAGMAWYMLAREKEEPVTDGTLVYRTVQEEYRKAGADGGDGLKRGGWRGRRPVCADDSAGTGVGVCGSDPHGPVYFLV